MVVSYVLAAIRPVESTLTMLLIFAPLADIFATIFPFILAVAVYLILMEITGVSGLVTDHKHALTLLLSFFICARVDALIWPYLLAHSVLFVI